jgi:hypothetical protein
MMSEWASHAVPGGSDVVEDGAPEVLEDDVAPPDAEVVVVGPLAFGEEHEASATAKPAPATVPSARTMVGRRPSLTS